MTAQKSLQAIRDALGGSLFEMVAGPDGPAERKRIHHTPGPRWFAEDRPIRRVHADASMFGPTAATPGRPASAEPAVPDRHSFRHQRRHED